MASLTKSASNSTIRDLVSKEKVDSSWEMMPQVTSYAQLHEPTQTFTLNTHCWMRQKAWGDRAHLFLVEQGDRLPVLSSDGFSAHVRTDSGLHLSQNEVTQPWTEVYRWQNRNDYKFSLVKTNCDEKLRHKGRSWLEKWGEAKEFRVLVILMWWPGVCKQSRKIQISCGFGKLRGRLWIFQRYKKGKTSRLKVNKELHI